MKKRVRERSFLGILRRVAGGGLLAAVVSYSLPAAAQPLAGIATCGAAVNTAPSLAEPPASLTSNQISDAVTCLINAERTSRGLNPLSVNAFLTGSAHQHALEGARLKWWVGGADSHVHPEIGPRTPNEAIGERIRVGGFCAEGARRVSEITYTGSGGGATPAAAVNWWMNISTAGHRDRVLEPQMRELGVGFAGDLAFPSASTPAERGAYVVHFGDCPTIDPGAPPSDFARPEPAPRPGAPTRTVVVRFTKLKVNECREAGTCDWKLVCNLGSQPDTELIASAEGDTGAEIAINRALQQSGTLPVTAKCTVREHDGGIGARWELIGTETRTLTTSGEQQMRINQNRNEGDVTVHLAVEQLGTISQGASTPPPPFIARHNLDAPTLQRELDRLRLQGYRPIQLSGYNAGGRARFAVVWARRDGPAWVARQGLEAAAYQVEFDAQERKGYRLMLVNGYTISGIDRFAAIWEKRPAPPTTVRHGLSASAFQAEIHRLAQSGHRPVHASGYGDGGTERFATIWEQRGGPPFMLRFGLTPTQFEAEHQRLTREGFRIVQLNGYGGSDGMGRFVAIWEKREGVFEPRHGLTPVAYQADFDRMVRQGFRLLHVSGYDVEGSDRLAAVWTR